MKTLRKQLYESIDCLNAKISQQNKIIQGLTTGYIDEKNSINPQIKNSCSYNVVLRTADKIQAISRYDTYIPDLNLPSNRLEALFYDFGSLCFFIYKGELRVSTYAKGGKLNGIGDLTSIKPIDFAGISYPDEMVVVYTHTLVRNPAIIINDYSGCWTESNIIPRAAVNSVSMDDEAMVYRQLKNAIKITAKKAIAICESETQREAAEKILLDWYNNDNPIGSVVGSLQNIFKINNLDTAFDIEPYLKSIDTFSKLRSNFNGIKTRSPNDKKERLITSEVENTNELTEFYLYDGLVNRNIGIDLLKKYSMCSNDAYCKINDVHEKLYPNDMAMSNEGD